MEKQISELKELNEEEIVNAIYERINIYWNCFPNLWKYTSKDEVASNTVISLYRPRKEDGVPHIIYYYNTKGDRDLKKLIGVIVYNELKGMARDIHSTGIFKNEQRRNVHSPLSLDAVIGENDGSELTLADLIVDDRIDIFNDINYTMLLNKMPNRIVNDVFYTEGNTYKPVTYRMILQGLIDGYNMTQLGQKMLKRTNKGTMVCFRDIGNLVKEMRRDIKQYLAQEYNYTEDCFAKGWSL